MERTELQVAPEPPTLAGPSATTADTVREALAVLVAMYGPSSDYDYKARDAWKAAEEALSASSPVTSELTEIYKRVRPQFAEHYGEAYMAGFDGCYDTLRRALASSAVQPRSGGQDLALLEDARCAIQPLTTAQIRYLGIPSDLAKRLDARIAELRAGSSPLPPEAAQ